MYVEKAGGGKVQASGAGYNPAVKRLFSGVENSLASNDGGFVMVAW